MLVREFQNLRYFNPTLLFSVRLRQLASTVRFKPFDVANTEGRSRERYRRLVLTSLASALTRIIGIVMSLVTVPLTLGYLGIERYGLWMTISSVIALLGFADMGLGLGLVSAISEADGKDDHDLAHRYVSSGFFTLSFIALLITIAFIIIYPVIQWPRLFNVTSYLAARESGPAMAVFMLCFVVSLPLGIVNRVQMGYQEGFANNLWQGAGNLAGFAGLLVAIYLRAGLPWLVLCMAGIPALATLLHWLVQFAWLRPGLMPSWRRYEWATSQRIIGTGLLFLTLQLLALVGNGSDNLIIAHVLGASAVASYSVVQRMFSITLLAHFFVDPLWSAFGEAMSRSDYVWARKTLNRALILIMSLAFVTALPLVVFGKQIIALWVGPHLVPSNSLLFGFGIWVLYASYGGVMSAFLNNGMLLKNQVWFYATASIVTFVLKITMIHFWQTSGIVWATVLGYGIFYAVPAAALSYKTLKSPLKEEVDSKLCLQA